MSNFLPLGQRHVTDAWREAECAIEAGHCAPSPIGRPARVAIALAILCTARLLEAANGMSHWIN
jgi:hypothetical protein